MKHPLATLVVLAACTFPASACPMCKDSVPNREGSGAPLRDSYDSGGQNISGGMNASVYVMLGAVLGTFGMVAAVMIKGMRSSGVRHGFPVRANEPSAK